MGMKKTAVLGVVAGDLEAFETRSIKCKGFPEFGNDPACDRGKNVVMIAAILLQSDIHHAPMKSVSL